MSIEGEAVRLHQRYKRGEISPVEVTRSQLDALPGLDEGINAFVLVDEAVALKMARDSEERYRNGVSLGPLDGVPITIKDTLNVAGWPTRRGSRTTSDAAAPDDTVSMARLRSAGAVFLGKTTTPEFAWKGLTESPLNGVTTNPLDRALHAGGSSGGAAAATALGIGVAGIGSDAAGSVRIPAAFCGVVGYKPTFGTIPLVPYPSAFWRLPHVGPITRTVADAALVASVMSGSTGADPSSLGQVPLRERLEDFRDSSGIRIGVPTGVASYLAPEVREGWEDALSILFPNSPVVPVDVQIEESRDIVAALYRLGCAYAVALVPKDRRTDLHADILDFIEPVMGLRADELLALQRRREEIASRTSALLTDNIDVLLTPTMSGLPPRVDAAAAAVSDWFAWCPFTPLFNLSHGPAVSVPWRGSAGAFPIGLQVGAASGRDGPAIAVAAMIEAAAARRSAAWSRITNNVH